MSGDELAVPLADERVVEIVDDNVLQKGNFEIKVYKKRWLILILYLLSVMLSCGHWMQYSIIANVVSAYYGVSAIAVDWTVTINMLFYMIFIFPFTYVEQKIGLRQVVLLGNSLCCIGSWIKTFSVSPDRFYITFIGQSMNALSVALLTMLPSRVSAIWFGSNQLSTATTIGALGPQLGLALTFLITPILVKMHDNVDDIGHDLFFLFRSYAIGTSINLVLCILLFQNEPRHSPSVTRALQKISRIKNKEDFIQPMKRLFTNKSYLVFCNTYGLNVGLYDAIGTFLNPMIIAHFMNGEEDAGRIGMLITITGMISSVILGMILDRTHKYKEITVITYFCTFCGEVLFAVAIFLEIKWMVYTSAIFLGFFISGYLAIGFEMASEYTYPESEAYSAGVMNIFTNGYGVVLIPILGVIMENYGEIPVNIIIAGLLLLGSIISAMIKNVRRRQDARSTVDHQGLPIKNCRQE